MPSRLARLTVVSVCLSFTPSILAQLPLLREDLQRGRNAALAIEDVDADGTPDLLTIHSDGLADTIDLRSGADGSIIRSLYDGLLGLRVALLSDQNGDGIFDLLVSESNFGALVQTRGRLRVVSGLDGSVLQEIEGIPGPNGRWIGIHAGSLGDVDGDGTDDLVTTTQATGPNRARAIVYSGASGVPLYETVPETFQINRIDRITAFATLEDINGDGIRDFAVGYERAALSGVSVGAVIVHSGADGSVLVRSFGSQPDQGLGRGLTGLDDQDGDGIGDYLVTSRLGSEVRSGATHAALFSLPVDQGFGPEFNGLTEYWARLGDLDGDGRAELAQTGLVASTLSGTYSIDIFRGGSGQPFRRIVIEGQELLNPTVAEWIPLAMSSDQDFDGDGISDVVTTEIRNWSTRPSQRTVPRLTVHSVTPQRRTAIAWRGMPCMGGLAPTIHPAPAANPAGVDIQVRGAPVGRAAILVLGLSQIAPLPGGGFPRLPGAGCQVYLQPNAAVVTAIATVGSDGQAVASLPILPFPGLLLSAQWLVDAAGQNPAGLVTTDSIVIRY